MAFQVAAVERCCSISVMAAGPAPVADVDDRRFDGPAQVRRELAAIDEDARRERRPDLRQVAGDRRELPLRLAHTLAWQ